jgi:hypothetical protein
MVSTVSIDEIDKDISDGEHLYSSMPRSNPLRPAFLSTLANLHLLRYELSDDRQDLNTSILQFTHAILLPFYSTKRDLNPIAALFSLAKALFRRSLKDRQLEDVLYCVKYLDLPSRPAT